MKITVTLLMFFVLFPLSTFAQDYTQWGLPEGAKARLGKGHITGNITYSPDGTRLAVASSIGIWIYDAHTGEELALLTGHTGDVSGVLFSPDGVTLASWGEDKTVRLWDANTGAHLRMLTGHGWMRTRENTCYKRVVQSRRFYPCQWESGWHGVAVGIQQLYLPFTEKHWRC